MAINAEQRPEDEHRADEDDHDDRDVEEQRLRGSQRDVGLLELVLDPGQHAHPVGHPTGERDHVLHEARVGLDVVGVLFAVGTGESGEALLEIAALVAVHREQRHGEGEDGARR